ncbi:hypothetical protein, partial [Stenotrophomonas maltophilia]|uniref:hypothetical protein n=1 Tax=Stenotrophomonas maltophilia TaxID=40324 RepID=UPI001F50768D
TRLHLAAQPTQDTDASRLTTLEIEKDGARQAIAAPKEMDGYTAVGLACVQDRSGTPYFVVQYGELPFGCSFCEWYYLYDASGRQLTHSTPPLRSVFDVVHLRVLDAERVDQLLVLVVVGLLLLAFRAAQRQDVARAL